MKNIIISGGCGFLGQEFTKTLSKDNRVLVFDLPEEINKKRQMNFFNSNIEGYGVDITSEYMVQYTIKYIYEVYGSIDFLINCAAYNEQPKDDIDNSFETYSLEKWRRILDVNLTGSFLLSRECIFYMLKNENEGFKGTIINVASDLGIISPDQSIYENGYIKPVDYCVSKAGLIHLTKYIASYYQYIIKSVCLIPGSVDNGQSDILKKNLENRIPIGRLARVDEYNESIKFLCSSGSDYMQGNNLIMDGGRSII